MSAAKKWRDLSEVELRESFLALSKDLFCIRNEIKLMQKMENLHKLKSLKKDRARILTILWEKGQSSRRQNGEI